MAGTITFSGLSSGLDTSSWIDALVSVKQSTISSLQDKLTIQQNIQNVVSNIKSFFTSFQSCLQKITDSQFGVANMDIFAQNIVNSSNINIATASATTEAARQSYDVLVEQLATYTKAKSGYKDVDVIKANLDTTLGQLGMKKGTITVGTGSFTVTENDTIRDLVAKFNSIGVTASFDEPKAKLTVNTDVNNIDDGSTKLKSVFGLENNPTQITVPKPGGSLTTPEHFVTIYADGNTLLSELGITDDMSYTAYDNNDTVLASNISNLSGLTINEFVAQLNTNGLNASFDEENHKISINNGYITGTLADALGISKQTVSTSTVATTESTLADIGITEKKTLSINGGEAVEYDTDTKLSDIMSAITTAGGSASLVDGNLTVSGVQLSGTLVDALGLVETGETTSVTSGTLQVTEYTTTTSTDKLYTSETLGISWDTNIGEILGEDTTALGFNIGGSEKSYTTSTKLSDIKSDIIAAGGTMELDTENNKIIISGVEVSGTLATALGLTNPTYTTSISSNTPVYVAGSSGNADSNTKLVDVGIAEGTYSINIFDEAGTSKYSNSNFSVQSDTTVGDFLNAVNSNLGAGSATITDGVITITNGYVTGTLAEALGIGTENIITGVTITSSQLSYYGYEPSDWIGEVTIKSGTANIAVSNGPIATVEEKIDLSSFFIGTVNKNNTATTGRVSEISNFSSGGCYLIEDASDLTALATLVNSGKSTTGVTFILNNDIDLSSVANFTPIGSSSNAFRGEFYGNGHVIKNLTIDSSSDYTGLFGNIEGATIRDLGIVDANVTSTGSDVGILVGYAYGGYITNCYVTGTVSGADYVGGLVGIGYGLTITDSYATCNVTGTDNVGGLVGDFEGASLTNCYATGTVSGAGYVGGLVGFLAGDLNEPYSINKCYATGDVSGSDYYIGGFVGWSGDSTITNSYSSGSVTGTAGSKYGFIGYDGRGNGITNCVYNSDTGLTSGVSSGVTGLTLAQMQTQSVMEAQGFTAENGWSYTSGLTPHFGDHTVYVSELTGFTSGDTYHISTAADLQKLAELVNAGAYTRNVTFILDNDIDLSSVANFTPIGSDSNKFKGTFYGNGHVIKNLTINNSNFCNTGLFGYTNGATIRDLGIVDANVTSTGENTGILVGYASGGEITNCYVTGTVSGADYVGGLVGWGSSDLTITDSYATCNVTGTNFVGGLVGDFEGASLTNCYATGTVSGAKHVGGLVGLLGYGFVGSINKCYATGNVSGSDSYIGGLVGWSYKGTITNSYSSGTVTGTGSNVYGFVGFNRSTITNCVYNSDTGRSSGVSSGVTGLTLAQMQTQSVMEAQGFTAENGWVYSIGNTPGLRAISGSTTQTLTSSNPANVTLEQLSETANRNLSITVDGTTYSNTFTNTSSVQDVLDWINDNVTGVTASLDSSGNLTLQGDGDVSASGGVWESLYTDATTQNTSNTMSTANTASRTLTYTTSDTIIDGNTTVGDLMDAESGTFNITIGDFSGNYGCSTTLSTVLNDINNSGNGYTASIVDGVFSVSGDGQFNISGDLGLKLYGENGTTTHNPTYTSDTLSSTTSTVADGNTTLAELGVNSGNFRITDKDGNLITTIDITDSMKISDLNSAISSYGSVSITDGKVTATLNGAYRLEDGTSNLITKLKLNTYSDNISNLTESSTLAQMGFGAGGTIEVSIDGVAQTPISFDGSENMSDIISRLNALGITASVSGGKFTATSDHEFTLGGNLGNWLVSGSANGYVTTADGYKTESPLMAGADNYRAESEELVYNTAMTTQSTLEQLGLSSGGTLNVNKGGSYTPYNLGKDTKIQDIIDILANNHNITASVDSNGKFTATSTDETFTLSGTIADILTQGGTYINTTTGYTSDPLSYNSNGAVDTSTKLTDLGVATGDVYIIENDVATGKDINITNDTTIGQFFNALSVYGMQGSIETNAAGESFIRITSDTNTKLVDGTSDLVTKLGFNEIRQGDFTGNVIYWDDDATSGLITEDMLITSFDKGGFSAVGTLSFQTGTGDDAVSHTITITDKDTVGTLLQKFKNEGVNAELDDGIIKISAGLDTITLTGGTSGLVNTIGLDVGDVDIYAQNSDELQHEGLSSYSAANYADGDTLLSTVNVTDGIMSIYVDGIRCTVEVDSTQTFSNLFSAISDEIALKTGLTAKVGFLDKNGDVVQNPTAENNTGVISILVEGDHKVVVGASNDKTNFATIANLVNSNENNVTGSRALFKVNASSKITDSGLFRAGDITEGSFKIGDATFTIDSETTISDLVQQINRSETSYATAYWDSLSGTLVLQSTETGESLINIEAIDSNFTNIMGFTQTKGGVDSLVTENQKLGSNAQVRINGTAITCDKNVIKSEVSKIKGLTINLKNVSAGETVTITVEQDKDSIYNAVSDTIDAYNTMMEALNKELADRDSLGGESILKLMRNNLKRLMTGTVNGTYVYRNMSAVGISTGEARNDVSTDVTSLVIDKDKFMDALTNDSDAVKTLLIGSQANPGVFLQANNIVTKALSTSGYFSNMENTLSKNITNLDKKISKTTMFVENYRARLEKQFKLMESTISGLQNAYANLLNG